MPSKVYSNDFFSNDGCLLFFSCRLNETQKSLLEGNEMIDRLSRTLSEAESEIGHLRRRNGLLETQRDKDKQQIAELQDTMNRMRMASVQSCVAVFSNNSPDIIGVHFNGLQFK